MKLHFFKRGLCVQFGPRYYPIYPAWTAYVRVANARPKMDTRGRIYFDKRPKISNFPKQAFNPFEGWLDS